MSFIHDFFVIQRHFSTQIKAKGVQQQQQQQQHKKEEKQQQENAEIHTLILLKPCFIYMYKENYIAGFLHSQPYAIDTKSLTPPLNVVTSFMDDLY
jgi:hypothetical protein